MQAIWSFILRYTLGHEAPVRLLDWTPDVRPSYEKDQKLPAGGARLAVRRGIDWHAKAKMLLDSDGWNEYRQLWKLKLLPQPATSNIKGWLTSLLIFLSAFRYEVKSIASWMVDGSGHSTTGGECPIRQNPQADDAGGDLRMTWCN